MNNSPVCCDTIAALKSSARQLLEENILPFWLDKMQDHEHGGFYGRIDGHDMLHPKADKGAVLNARILWTFASAYRVLSLTPDPFPKERGVYSCDDYLKAALRAKEYILEHFIDHKRGGVYWSVDYLGRPVDMKKQSYAIGFTIYGMSELARATGDQEALRCAVALFNTLEKHAYDRKNNGYIEAMTYDWRPIDDMRLSYKDENGSRTMNTHLHILEPYTNLYRALRASPSPSKGGGVGIDKSTGMSKTLSNQTSPPLERLGEALRRLIAIFTQKLLNPQTHHLDLFFNDQWQKLPSLGGAGGGSIESYGHDIEAAWLLTESLEVLGDEELMQKTMPIVNQIARASEEGLLPDGSMVHEKKGNETDDDRHWWVQCENVIGQLNQYQYFDDHEAFRKAVQCYEYIKQNLIDNEHGEWYWSRCPDGTINRDEDKAGFWKCPYHNSRMCLEILEREF